MPWTLFYPLYTLEDRAEYRREVAELRNSPDVEFVGDLRRGWPLLEAVQDPSGERTVIIVRFHDELHRTEDPSLLEIHERRRPPREPEQLRLPQTERPPTVQEQIITEYLRDPGGRARLAAAMANPLRRRMDYHAIGRRTFLVEELPPGALPIYDRDPDVTHAVAPEPEPNLEAMRADLEAFHGCDFRETAWVRILDESFLADD